MATDSPQKRKVACPGCGKQYLVPAEAIGKTLKCKACQKAFRLAPPRPAVATVAAAAAPVEQRSAGNCAICQSPITATETLRQCPACAGTFHDDCWEYNHGCGIYGCAEAPPTEGLTSIEIPPSHWGQDNKQCPKCSQPILAAAVRCKHCGATFQSATPQDRAAFQEQQSNRDKLPAVKIAAVVLLIFSLIPCTAPLVAIGGSIWYAINRKSIAMLPPFHAALAKIAVAVSFVVTILLVVFAVLNTSFGG